MAIFFVMMLLAYIAGNIYIYVRGLQAIHHLPLVVRWIYSLCFWAIALSFVFVFILRNARVNISMSHVLFDIGTGWLIFTLYMVLLLGCTDLIHLFNKSFHNGFFISLLLTLCLLAYGYVRYQHPVAKVINIVINKTIPEPATSFKIVAISDVHLGLGTEKSKLTKYVEMINKQAPDVILICGDLIDNSVVPVINQQMHIELSRLNARFGVYMVPGNHEYISGLNECMRFLQQTNVHVLRDTAVTLPNGVQIVGRDDRSNRSRKDLTQLMQGTDPSRPVIVLDHQPVEIKEAVDAGADLLLCGHTHNGQVWPLNLLTKRMFEISYGYQKRSQTHIYVTSGLSLWGPPFRIGTQSEMAVIQLQLKIKN